MGFCLTDLAANVFKFKFTSGMLEENGPRNIPGVSLPLTYLNLPVYLLLKLWGQKFEVPL